MPACSCNTPYVNAFGARLYQAGGCGNRGCFGRDHIVNDSNGLAIDSFVHGKGIAHKAQTLVFALQMLRGRIGVAIANIIAQLDLGKFLAQ